MRQPKYKFGRAFTKEVTSSVEGNRFKTRVTHYVIGVKASSSDTDFNYIYTLASSKPSAYTSPEFTTEVYEDKLLVVYNQTQEQTE